MIDQEDYRGRLRRLQKRWVAAQTEIELLRNEIAMWKDRYEAEKQAHTATIPTLMKHSEN